MSTQVLGDCATREGVTREDGEKLRVGVSMPGSDDGATRKNVATKRAKKFRGCDDCATRKDVAMKKAKSSGRSEFAGM